jgi:hypothetical protein
MKQIEPRQKARSPTRLMPMITLVTVILALAISSVAVAKKCDFPPCKGDDGNSSAYYDVTIGGSMDGAGEYWMASTNGQVNYQHFDPAPSTGSLDLTFFQNHFPNGHECFLEEVSLHAVILNYKKSTGAQARFWFHGKTYQGDIPVVYVLTLNGVLDKTNWPPAEGVPNLMEMNTWRMRLANEGSEIQEISCLEEGGDFSSDTGKVDIDVSWVSAP